MKRFLTCVLFIAATAGLSAQQFAPPRLNGRVNDYADILSPSVESSLSEKLADLERTDSTQVVVLTVPSLEGLPIEEYSLETVEAWKLGTKENDNGALLLIAPSERKMRIETGYGLEGVLTDIRAGRIIDTVIAPEFRLGRYNEGVAKGVDAIIATVRGEYTGTGTTGTEASGGEEKTMSLFPILILAFVISLLGSRKRIFGGIGGAILLPLFALFLFPGALPFILFLIPGGFILGLVLSFLRFLPPAGGMYGRRGRYRHRPGGFGGFWGGFGGSGGRSGGGWGGGGGGFSGGRGGGFGGGGASGGW